MSADVELQNISINFGDFYAAKDVSVMIKKGSFLASLAHLVAAKPPSFEPFQVFWNHHKARCLLVAKTWLASARINVQLR